MEKKSTAEVLQANKEYSAYQEELAFEKELNILRNDFYYKMIDSKDISLVDFFYQPLDTLSGDAYTARVIDENRTFYLLVDGMGKGLSASLSAMAATIFINHIIDKMIEHDSFSIDILVKESMDFMKPILLDEEALSIDYILFDTYFSELEYAKFSMPPFLLEDYNNNVMKIKSNNPPMSKWNQAYNIDKCSVKNIHKFLFYSDGIVENTTAEGLVYNDFIENDFRASFTREEMKENILNKIATQEDDLTFIFINRLELNEDTLAYENVFDTSLDSVEKANNWYENICHNSSNIIAFNELFMNAYEHGNLGIDSDTKHKLLTDETYIDTLLKYEKNSMGIYYNSKGNSVLFLNKIQSR